MASARDPEIAAITAISDALMQVSDVDARRRVLVYVLARFAPDTVIEPPPAPAQGVTATAPGNPSSGSAAHSSSAPSKQPGDPEMPGIARLSDAGELKITVRDLKAKSGLDAAVRLAHVAIYAYDRLSGGQPLSSSKGLTPILKEWRLYDGNTRTRLGKEKGIVRDGDGLRLDAHSRRDAEKYIEEILDSNVEGKWRAR